MATDSTTHLDIVIDLLHASYSNYSKHHALLLQRRPRVSPVAKSILSISRGKLRSIQVCTSTLFVCVRQGVSFLLPGLLASPSEPFVTADARVLE